MGMIAPTPKITPAWLLAVTLVLLLSGECVFAEKCRKKCDEGIAHWSDSDEGGHGVSVQPCMFCDQGKFKAKLYRYSSMETIRDVFKNRPENVYKTLVDRNDYVT